MLFGGVVLLVALFNFFITSGSARYTLMAPVLVPMLMLMLIGVSPEVTQMLYRMGEIPLPTSSPPWVRTSHWRWDISSVITRKPVWEPCPR